MSLDTPFFLCIFLPAVILPYSLISGYRFRKLFLLTSSFLFCAFGSLSGAVVLLISSVACYALGYILCKWQKNKIILGIGISIQLVCLITFRYIRIKSLAVPLGISYFIFKCISYLADVYRDSGCAAKRIDDLLLYISFFPQLSAGPIARFSEFSLQPDLAFDRKTAAMGLQRYIIGLGKKLFLAVPMGQISDLVFAAKAPGFSLSWIGAAAFMMHIYYDFSGYSDMAIGLGNMFGIRTGENFRYPYTACSVTDFWRRWHISLSVWIRDYIYIPLGGNRKGTVRAAVNKLISFAICGLWHGFSLTYLLWGVWHGLFAAFETLGVIHPRRNPAGRVYTMAVVLLGFVLFRAGEVQNAFCMLASMTGFFRADPESLVLVSRLLSPYHIIVFCICTLLCCDWQAVIPSSLSTQTVKSILTFLLLAFCLSAMAAVGFQPFLYAQF